jgi:hypothetical protein
MSHPFSETYIAMAKAAEEIQAVRPTIDAQAGWNPPHNGLGSVFCKPYNDGFEFRALAWDNDTEAWMIGGYHEGDEEFSWLPRLDQLMAMLGGPNDFRWEAIQAEDGGSTGWIHFKDCDVSDWHELALAVVMREKHGKTWRDGQWVKV